MNQRTLLLTLTQKRRFTLKVEGASMLPLLHPEDVLTLERTKFSRVRENDVVLVIKGRQPMIHRVIYKSKSYLITRGDHRMKSDGQITSNQVYAKVTGVKRGSQKFRLEDYYLIQSTRYFKEIAALCDVFVKHEIVFVILKGLPLHLFLESTHPRRIYADFDILIAPSHYSRAHRILSQLRYESVETAYSPTHKRLKNKLTSLSYHKHSTDFPAVIDLHMEPVFLFNQLGRLDALYPQQLLDQMTEDFLKHKQWVTIENHHFPILSPAQLFIYLCLHFFHHNFQGVYRLQLIDTLARRSQKKKNEWKEIANIIKQYRLKNFLTPTYYFLQKYFSAPHHRTLLKSTKSDPCASWYTKRYIAPTTIFDDENRLHAGIRRFTNLLFLSPQPVVRRLTILVNPAVWFSLFWSFWQIIRYAVRSLRVTIESD